MQTTQRPVRAVLALVASAAITLAACGGDDDSAAPTTPAAAATSAGAAAGDEAGAAITIEGFGFHGPSEVAAGTTITVTNNDSVAHTLTADDGSFDTGRLGPGESGTITVTTAGEFTYHCNVHPSMTGSITVTG